MSANISGRRIDYVTAPGYEFLDGRGQWTERGNLGVAGSVVRRECSGGRLELIDLYGNDRIVFQAQPDGVLTAYDAEDRSLGQAQLSSPRAGWKEFKPVAGGRKYIFAPRAQPLP